MSMITEQEIKEAIAEAYDRAKRKCKEWGLEESSTATTGVLMGVNIVDDILKKRMERSSAYYGGGWIPCEERMPEEREWMGTKRFGTTKSDEVYVTFEMPDKQRFTKHISFQNGELSPSDQMDINAFFKGARPIAWCELPAPYQPESEG